MFTLNNVWDFPYVGLHKLLHMPGLILALGGYTYNGLYIIGPIQRCQNSFKDNKRDISVQV